MIDVLVCLLTVGLAVVWYKNSRVRTRKDKSTQTELDLYLMELLCDTSPLLSIASMSDDSDVFKLSDLDIERSVECDENYFGDSERLDDE